MHIEELVNGKWKAVDPNSKQIFPIDVPHNQSEADMRILDEIANKSISNLTLLLEKAEAIQLIGYLEELVSVEGIQSDHYHLNNTDYSNEITIALYDDSNLDNFSDRYKLLITKDE